MQNWSSWKIFDTCPPSNARELSPWRKPEQNIWLPSNPRTKVLHHGRSQKYGKKKSKNGLLSKYFPTTKFLQAQISGGQSKKNKQSVRKKIVEYCCFCQTADRNINWFFKPGSKKHFFLLQINEKRLMKKVPWLFTVTKKKWLVPFVFNLGDIEGSTESAGLHSTLAQQRIFSDKKNVIF